MRILVTGNEGFIGGHLQDALQARGDTVWGMDLKNGTPTSLLSKTLETVEEFGPELIVHLGANCSSQISLRNPTADFYLNAVGTFNVVESARRFGGIPVIFNSTMKVLPGEDGLVPPYGVTKSIGETLFKLYQDLYQVPHVINRPSSVYGPRQDGSDDGGWFTWFIKASITGERINLYGDGTQSRDVLYISDHVALLLDQIDHFDAYRDGTYDFGGGLSNEVSLNELLDALDYHNVEYKPRLQGDVQRFVNDNESTTAVRGWKPQVDWRTGLDLTRKYFLSVQ